MTAQRVKVRPESWLRTPRPVRQPPPTTDMLCRRFESYRDDIPEGAFPTFLVALLHEEDLLTPPER